MDVFADCLKKGRLKAVEPDIEGAARELETSRGELERARQAYVQGRWEDVITQSYFAMHRCARAAINSRGYKDTNLYGLLAGVERLFVEPGHLPEGTGKRISEAKDIKDSVYNGGRAGPREARTLLVTALEMAKVIFGLLKLPGFDGEAIDTTLPERVDPQRSGPRPDRDAQPRSNESGFTRPDRYANGELRRPSRFSQANSWRTPGSSSEATRWRPGFGGSRAAH